MAVVPELIDGLEAETEALLGVLEGLRGAEFDLVTEASPWTVKDTIAHLAFFDDQQRLAIVDPSVFARSVEQALALDESFVDLARDTYRDENFSEVLEWFETSRADLLHSFRNCDHGARLRWFGPSMSVASALTARLMETWAHGVDITDALGRSPHGSERLRHVVRLAHRARPFAYAANHLEMPTSPLRFELMSPNGELWCEGDDDATSVVVGDALDLCLVATQRRNVVDTGLVASDGDASQWLSIAQAFAGPPGPGRAPRMSQ